MSRLTITLPEARCRALKEAAAKRGRTIDQLVEESLESVSYTHLTLPTKRIV